MQIKMIKKNWLDIIFAVVIFGLCNHLILQEIAPVSWDETGYISQAAFMAGENWQDVTGILPYYSYGNAFFASVLFRLISNPIALYRSILLFDSVLIVASYFLAKKIFVLIFQDTDERTAAVISFVCVIYPSNIAYTDMHLSESYITFVFWMISYLSVLLVKRGVTLSRIGTYAVLLVYAFYIHQRLLGIVISGVLLVVLLMLRKEIKPLPFIAFLIGVVCLLYLGNIYKSYAKSMLWVNGSMSDLNDFGSYGDLISEGSFFIELSYIVSIIRSIMGKMWYICLASLGVSVFGLYELLIVCFKAIRKHNLLADDAVIALCALMAFALSMGIICFTSISLYYGRVDNLFLGRYMDALIGPYLLFGLGQFIKNNERFNIYVLLFLNVFLCKNVEDITHLTVNHSSVVDRISNIGLIIMLRDSYVNGDLLRCTVAVSIVEVLMYYLIHRKGNNSVVCVFLTAMFLANIFAFSPIMIEKQKKNNDLYSFASYIGDDDIYSIGYYGGLQSPIILKYIDKNLQFEEIGKRLTGNEGYDYLLFTSEDYGNRMNASRWYQVALKSDNYVLYEKKSMVK